VFEIVALWEEREALLFEKRSKNFSCVVARKVRQRVLNWQKCFGSFFQKRTSFLRLPDLRHPAS
jgi:hypothetical protein